MAQSYNPVQHAVTAQAEVGRYFLQMGEKVLCVTLEDISAVISKDKTGSLNLYQTSPGIYLSAVQIF